MLSGRKVKINQTVGDFVRGRTTRARQTKRDQFCWSSVSRTFKASEFKVKGFCSSTIPRPRMPWCTIASSAYPDI